MSVKKECLRPEEIEKRSFEIISQELQDRNIQLDPEKASIIMRCIHSSADFDYVDNLYFSPQAVALMKEALVKSCCIVTDTQMVRSGVNKLAAAKLGVEVFCFMSDEDVAKEAKKREVTRALVAVEKAMKIDKPVLFAIGNAPTALLRLHEAISKESFVPAGIIAIPVGFVNVVESKELIMTTKIPCIVGQGRKGGSNIAAAICNALLYDLTKG